VTFENKTGENKTEDYTVDHSAFVYLMDRDGKYLGFFPPGTSAEKMVDMIRPYLGTGK
jgi:protein SCO1/2